MNRKPHRRSRARNNEPVSAATLAVAHDGVPAVLPAVSERASDVPQPIVTAAPLHPVALTASDPGDDAIAVDWASREKFDQLTFSLAQSEKQALRQLRKTRLVGNKPIKKSQLLRAGLLLVAAVDDERLAELLQGLPREKARRAKAGK